jgi:hypothetical protein
MELEYIKPIFFQTLARLQLDEDGKPEGLRRLEANVTRPANVGPTAEAASAPPADGATPVEGGEGDAADGIIIEPRALHGLEAWAGDTWTQSWLASDPQLGDVDLRPYFFIAHDKGRPLASADIRLSPAATEVLNRLLSSEEVSRALGLRNAVDLSTPDALSVFHELAERIRQAENIEGAPQSVMFSLVEGRPELLPQLIALYQGLPELKIQVSVPVTFVRLGRGTSSLPAVQSLLEGWAASTRAALASAAQAALVRLNRAT